MSEINAREVIMLAIEFEESVARLYRVYKDKFKGVPLTEFLWDTLSIEEEAHASFLRAQLGMMEKVPGAFGSENVSLSEMKAIMDDLKYKIEFAENNDVQLKDALCAALKIETSMVEKEYGRLIEVTSPSLSKIFSDLTMKDDHADKIRAALKALGVECR